jgi:hypothetical protein
VFALLVTFTFACFAGVEEFWSRAAKLAASPHGRLELINGPAYAFISLYGDRLLCILHRELQPERRAGHPVSAACLALSETNLLVQVQHIPPLATLREDIL